jgi:hypothetical protein
MANTFKLKTKANVGVTTVGIYTAPAATTTVVIGITMANTSGMAGNKVVLEATDTLTVDSDTNNSVDAALTIMEIT